MRWLVAVAVTVVGLSLACNEANAQFRRVTRTREVTRDGRVFLTTRVNGRVVDRDFIGFSRSRSRLGLRDRDDFFFRSRDRFFFEDDFDRGDRFSIFSFDF